MQFLYIPAPKTVSIHHHCLSLLSYLVSCDNLYAPSSHLSVNTRTPSAILFRHSTHLVWAKLAAFPHLNTQAVHFRGFLDILTVLVWQLPPEKIDVCGQ